MEFLVIFVFPTLISQRQQHHSFFNPSVHFLFVSFSFSCLFISLMLSELLRIGRHTHIMNVLSWLEHTWSPPPDIGVASQVSWSQTHTFIIWIWQRSSIFLVEMSAGWFKTGPATNSQNHRIGWACCKFVKSSDRPTLLQIGLGPWKNHQCIHPAIPEQPPNFHLAQPKLDQGNSIRSRPGCTGKFGSGPSNSEQAQPNLEQDRPIGWATRLNSWQKYWLMVAISIL